MSKNNLELSVVDITFLPESQIHFSKLFHTVIQYSVLLEAVNKYEKLWKIIEVLLIKILHLQNFIMEEKVVKITGVCTSASFGYMLACFAITWRSSEESGLLIPCNTIINSSLIWYAYKIKPRTLPKDGLYIILIIILNGCVIVDWLHKVLMSQHPLVITVITIISIIHFTVPVYFTESGAFLWINFIDFESCFDVQTEKLHPNIIYIEQTFHSLVCQW